MSSRLRFSYFFFSSRRRHTRWPRDWSSDVCSSDLDLEALRKMWSSDPDEEEARQMVATSVTFGEAWTVPVADLDAARRYGWKVAQPDAYPEVIHQEQRSEERRVGKEWRSRWSAEHR